MTDEVQKDETKAESQTGAPDAAQNVSPVKPVPAGVTQGKTSNPNLGADADFKALVRKHIRWINVELQLVRSGHDEEARAKQNP